MGTREWGRATVRTAQPEEVLNLCGRLGLSFRDVRWEPDGTVTFRLSRRDLARLVRAAEGLDLRVSGGRHPLSGFRRRPALVVSLTVSAVALFLCSFFIWDVQVEGCVTVPEEAVLRALERQGVGLGTFGLSLDGEDLRNHVLLDVPELAWLTVNVSGCRAHVQVRERVPVPEMVDGRTPSNVTARRAGLVLEVRALDGTAAVLPGATVEAGQLLISGTQDLDTNDGGTRVMAGRGTVTARTWHTLTTAVPLAAPARRDAGETVLRALVVGKRRFNLYSPRRLAEAHPGTRSDKTTRRRQWTFLGVPLPVTAVRETVRFYETVPQSRTAAQAKAAAETALRSQLLAEVSSYGEVRSALCTARQRGETLEVTLTAECVEEIGVVTPLYAETPPETG